MSEFWNEHPSSTQLSLDGCFRFTEDELRRFYVAANGDFSSLLTSVKKTIRWRETFHILTLQELDKWSHLVFWHGFDTMLRPCLVIRLGLACSSIPPRDRPRFGQAVGNFPNCSVCKFIYVLDDYRSLRDNVTMASKFTAGKSNSHVGWAMFFLLAVICFQ
jgi:hypothetical protein